MKAGETMEHLLKTLMEALGPSGSEVPVRTIIMKEIKPYVDELSVDKFGNINNGLQDFIKHWLGKYMQSTRDLLNSKNRADHEYCSMCKFTSIRCDIPYWKAGFEQYWNGGKWNKRKLSEPIVAKQTYQKISTSIKKKGLFDI